MLALAFALALQWHIQPPTGWLAVEHPRSFGKLHTLQSWREPERVAHIPQAITLGVQSYAYTLGLYVQATRKTLYSGPVKPVSYDDVPYACSGAAAHLIVYESAFFGPPLRFEQLVIKRGQQIYVATYARSAGERQNAQAATAIRRLCR